MNASPTQEIGPEAKHQILSTPRLIGTNQLVWPEMVILSLDLISRMVRSGVALIVTFVMVLLSAITTKPTPTLVPMNSHMLSDVGAQDLKLRSPLLVQAMPVVQTVAVQLEPRVQIAMEP